MIYSSKTLHPAPQFSLLSLTGQLFGSLLMGSSISVMLSYRRCKPNIYCLILSVFKWLHNRRHLRSFFSGAKRQSTQQHMEMFGTLCLVHPIMQQIIQAGTATAMMTFHTSQQFNYLFYLLCDGITLTVCQLEWSHGLTWLPPKRWKKCYNVSGVEQWTDVLCVEHMKI